MKYLGVVVKRSKSFTTFQVAKRATDKQGIIYDDEAGLIPKVCQIDISVHHI